MKKIFGYLFRIIIVLILIAITVFLGIKLYKDVKEIKVYEEEELNIEAEANYYVDVVSKNIQVIKEQVENDIGTTVEFADTGSICNIELYFVVKVDGEYKYIVTKNVDGVQKFAIAQSESEDGKYIISSDEIGLKDCIFTDIEKYVVDKDANVKYDK